MARETEERVIAYSLLVVAGVTTVGWFAWLVTAARPTGVLSLAVVGSILLTLASVLASVIGVYLSERSSHRWPSLARLVAIALVGVVILLTVSVALWGSNAGIVLVGTALAVVSVWAVIPLGVGAVRAATGNVSMIGVLLAWPPSNLLALALFVAPAPGGVDFAAGNALVLAEPLRSVVLLLVVTVATLGPALLGHLMDRLLTVRVDEVPV